jgi:hypothetical protein
LGENVIAGAPLALWLQMYVLRRVQGDLQQFEPVLRSARGNSSSLRFSVADWPICIGRPTGATRPASNSV